MTVQSHKNGKAADLVVGSVHVTLAWPEVERLHRDMGALLAER